MNDLLFLLISYQYHIKCLIPGKSQDSRLLINRYCHCHKLDPGNDDDDGAEPGSERKPALLNVLITDTKTWASLSFLASISFERVSFNWHQISKFKAKVQIFSLNY